MGSKRLRIIYENQIDFDLLKQRQVAIIGYGSQGRAQALNMRDSDIIPVIGLPSRSRSRKLARNDGFTVTTPARAVNKSDVIAILIPDHKHRELFENELYSICHKGQTFIFAHSLSVHFNLIRQPDKVDFALVAPHGPGLRLREKFLSGDGIPAFIGCTKISSKKSLKIAAAYAGAIGCARTGLIVSGFAEEAIGDIFGEQAVLCGGLSALLKSGYDTLVKAGLPSHNAYIECVYQLDLIVDLIKKYGINGMYDRISTTAAFGSLQAENTFTDSGLNKSMKSLLKKIKSGQFTDEMMADYKNSFRRLNSLKKKMQNKALDDMAVLFKKKFDD